MYDGWMFINVTIVILVRMKIWHIAVLLFCFMDTSRCVMSQSVQFKQITKEDGLASDVVYSTFQDSKGYIWICSQAMISRFDGQGFKNFDESRGLQLRAVFCASEDHDGRIWFASYGRQLYFIEGDTILPYRYNDSLFKYLDVAAAFHSLMVTKNNTVILGTPYDGMITIDSAGYVSNDFTVANKSPVRLDLWEVEGELLSATQFAAGAGRSLEHPQKSVATDRSDELEVRWKDENGHHQTFSWQLGKGWNHQRQFYQCRFNEDVILSYDRLLIRGIQGQNPDTVMVDELIISMSQIGDELLIGTYGKGILGFDDQLKPIDHPYRFLDGKTVSDIMEDHQGGVWFSVLGEGIYYVPNREIGHLFKDDIIWVLENGSGRFKLVAGSKTGRVYEKQNTWDFAQRGLGPLTHVSYLVNGTIIRGASKISRTGFSNLNIEKWHSVLSDVVEWNGNLYGMSSLGVVDFKQDTLLEFPTDIKTGRFSDLTTSESEIFILRTRELFEFDGMSFKKWEVPEPFGSSGYQCMAISDNRLAIGTTKRGLWLLSMEGDSLSFIQQLEESICEQVKFLNSETLVVATTDGISMYKRLDEWTKVSHFSRDQGLSSSMIYDFCYLEDTLWIATAKGLNYLTLNVFNKTYEPPITHMDGVILNGTELMENGSSVVYGDHSISITYTGISFRSGKDIYFKYRLNEEDGKWVETDQKTINYSSLPPGDYRFEVLALDGLGKEQQYPAVFEFSILPLFWQTTWFSFVCILFLLLVIGLIYRLNIRRIKFQLQKEQEFVFYQQRSVAMQMNPHFLYNSLNSIVKFISTNERQQAVRYLSRFAKLMRHFLNNSQKHFVSLEEEITALQLYCSLEKVRFKDRFDYRFNVLLKDDVEDLQIPTLLLQPAIENAIRHGIAHLETQGFLEVCIEQRDETLYVCIEDNGIGRKASASYRKKLGDDSSLHSTEITRTRIELLGKSLGKTLRYDIEDIMKDGQVRGTKVIFELPVQKL